MRKEEKNEIIELLAEKLRNTNHIYLTDISGLTVEDTNKLRALCFKREIGLQTVKNTLLRKAMDKVEDKDFSGLYDALKGSTAVMFSEINNTPAKLIQEVRKKNAKPILKGAYVEESCYLGDNQIAALVAIKSKEELIGEVLGLLQSPAKNVISALLSSGAKIAGIVKTLSEKE
jgi:large subunit ribosomal protein L10